MKVFSRSLAFLVPILTLGAGVLAPIPLHAENFICDVFPFLESIDAFGVNTSLCTGTPDEGALSSAGEMVRFALSLVFVAIIVISIYVIIRAALKYIRSEGDPGKVEEAQKAIKNVFIGIGALFVGVIGIIIILAFFQAGGAIDSEDVPEDSGIQDFFRGLTGGSGGDDDHNVRE
jgi:uncharacterized membrane protein YidH (DUF202 family)